MEEDSKKSMEQETEKLKDQSPEPEKEDEVAAGGGGGGGWGGWGFSPLSYLSDLQKAAAVAAEEISRNAAAVAQTAAKSLAEIQNDSEDSEASKGEDDTEGHDGDSPSEGQGGDEKEAIRRSALEKLEKASEDTFLSQGLKVIDGSVENIATGAWKAIGSALKGGSSFIQRLENSVQQDGTVGSGGPSLLETGKAFTYKGLQVLENVGKETIDLLISETGIEVDKRSDGADHQVDEDQLSEEITFDRCFYIYGGPEQLEELEALASHYALLFNRKKAKLSSEQKSFHEERVKQVQQILDLNAETNVAIAESDKGKKIETGADTSDNEMKSLRDSSVSKAADMAAGFTSALAGLAANDIVQRTSGRLESLHSEGVHRLSEICCFAASQLMMLAKSIISSANKSQEENAMEDAIKIDWPEDSLEKAKIIRTKAQSMTESLEAVSNSFITGISDVAEAYLAAIKGTAAADSEVPSEKSIQDKVKAVTEHLRTDQTTAVGKVQDGLQSLCYVVVSTSIPAA